MTTKQQLAGPAPAKKESNMTVRVPGYTTLTGRPETILRLLDETRIWDKVEGNDYIDSIIEAVERLWEYRLEVTGDTYEARALSLLKELDKYGLITIEE
jgi:hypothetical protein